MPLVKISIRKGRSASEKRELLDLVHTSLVDAFKIPEKDRSQRIYEFKDDEFDIPGGRTKKFTIIEITIFPGRSFEAKKNLYKLIFNQLKNLGYQDNDAVMVFYEPELSNWSVRDGVPASEMDLGFNLKV